MVHSMRDNGPTSKNLVKLLHAEVIEPMEVDAHGSDPSIFMPPPPNMRAVMKLKDSKAKGAWIRALKKELETLIKSKTFVIIDPPEGTKIIPTMEDLRVKILEDRLLDELKKRSIVTKNNWSPTASHRSLKIFLRNASKLKCRVKQLDLQEHIYKLTCKLTYGSIYQVTMPLYSQNIKILWQTNKT